MTKCTFCVRRGSPRARPGLRRRLPDRRARPSGGARDRGATAPAFPHGARRAFGSRPVALVVHAASPIDAPRGARSPTTPTPSRRPSRRAPARSRSPPRRGSSSSPSRCRLSPPGSRGGLRAPVRAPALVPFLALAALAFGALHGPPRPSAPGLACRPRRRDVVALARDRRRRGLRRPRAPVPRFPARLAGARPPGAPRRAPPRRLDRRRLPRRPAHVRAAPPRGRGDDRVPPPRGDRGKPAAL